MEDGRKLAVTGGLWAVGSGGTPIPFWLAAQSRQDFSVQSQSLPRDLLSP